MPNIEDDVLLPPHETAEPARAETPVAEERSVCWICGAPVNERHCKIVCPRCGFMRDCSDP